MGHEVGRTTALMHHQASETELRSKQGRDFAPGGGRSNFADRRAMSGFDGTEEQRGRLEELMRRASDRQDEPETRHHDDRPAPEPFRPFDPTQFPSKSSMQNSVTTAEPSVGEHAVTDRVTKLVHEYHLRDPLLAARSLSCEIVYGEGLVARTAVSAPSPDALEIRIDLSRAELDGVPGLSASMLEQALRTRFPASKVTVVFATDQRRDRDGGRDEA